MISVFLEINNKTTIYLEAASNLTINFYRLTLLIPRLEHSAAFLTSVWKFNLNTPKLKCPLPLETCFSYSFLSKSQLHHLAKKKSLATFMSTSSLSALQKIILSPATTSVVQGIIISFFKYPPNWPPCFC